MFIVVCVFFVDEKFAEDCSKDEIIPSLKEKCRIQFTLDVTLNNMIDKRKT